MLNNLTKLEEKANYIRNLILDMCVKAKTGHVTSSFSCTELLVALYYGGILSYDVSNPKWEGRDKFILSKGQASPILYVILADLGFFPKSALNKFCQADGMFGVHLQNDVPGVEITAGSLGHGLGIAAGLALAAKMDGNSYLTFALLGDGECYEGSIWESAMFASHHNLKNLIAIVDRNQLCVTGFTEDIVRLNPLREKWESFGWEALSINGHSFEEIFQVLEGVRTRKSNKPLVIIANTIKGKGVSFMENVPLWHGIAPKGKQARIAKAELTRKEQ
ncbi:MAG: transketolase [Desulfobacteraceae bacterium]|nr:transketolase [Desulfobacteraceae bacterium]